MVREWAKKELNFKDGKEDGLLTIWHENGQKSYEIKFKDGKKDGLWTGWYDNGQKSSEGNSKRRKEDGLWPRWQEDGNLTSKTKYKYKDETSTVTHYWVSTEKRNRKAHTRITNEMGF